MYTIQGWLILKDKTTSIPLKIPAQTTFNSNQKTFIIEMQIPEFNDDGTLTPSSKKGNWLNFLNQPSFQKNKHKYHLLGFLVPEKISEFIKGNSIPFENFPSQSVEITHSMNDFSFDLKWAPSILNTSHSLFLDEQKKETFLNLLFEKENSFNQDWLLQSPQLILPKPANEKSLLSDDIKQNPTHSSETPQPTPHSLPLKNIVFGIPDEIQYENDAAASILTHPKILSFNDLEIFSKKHSKITQQEQASSPTVSYSENKNNETKTKSNDQSFSFSLFALPTFLHSYPQEEFGLLVCDSFMSPDLFDLSKPYWKGKYDKKSIFSFLIISDLIQKEIPFSINGISINSSFLENHDGQVHFNYKKLAFELNQNNDKIYYNFYLNHLRNLENQQLHVMFDNAPHLSFSDVPATSSDWIPFYLAQDNSPACWLHPDGFLCYSTEPQLAFDLQKMDQFLMLNDSKFKDKFNRILDRAKEKEKTPEYFMKTDQHFILPSYDLDQISWKKNNIKKPSN